MVAWTPGVASASVVWGPPATSGGLPLLGYVLSCTDGTIGADDQADQVGVGSHGDQAHQRGHLLLLRARSAAGAGAASSPIAVTPQPAPKSPTNLSVMADVASAVVTFTLPIGPAADIFTVTCTSPVAGVTPVSQTGTTTAIEVTGLVSRRRVLLGDRGQCDDETSLVKTVLIG